MKINVVDAGCGVGKTTALIKLINNDTSNQKYIFITPFLSEVERIKKSCPDKKFVSPDENNKTKLEHFSRLINEGRNIVTTHALFKKIDRDRISIEALHNYVLIMDEVADIVEELPVSKSDLKLLSNKVTIHPRTHMVEWNDNDYQGKFDEYKRMIRLNNIFAYVDKDDNIVSMMWLFPYRVFQAFQQIYILTYMFDGQIQKKYFDYFGADYANWYVKDFHLTPTPQVYDYKYTKSLINVCQDQKLNEVGDNRTALSISWFSRNRRTQEMTILQNNIRSFFRSHAKVPSNKMLWTTFKEYKYNVKIMGNCVTYIDIIFYIKLSLIIVDKLYFP